MSSYSLPNHIPLPTTKQLTSPSFPPTVTGSGSSSGFSTVSFPGAYPSNDPGIVVSIYGTNGNADMGGRTYQIPGPRPISCSGGNNNGGSPTTGSGSQPTGGSGSVALYGQCGGSGYSGPTSCAQGTCTAQSQWYSQCLP